MTELMSQESLGAQLSGFLCFVCDQHSVVFQAHGVHCLWPGLGPISITCLRKPGPDRHSQGEVGRLLHAPHHTPAYAAVLMALVRVSLSSAGPDSSETCGLCSLPVHLCIAEIVSFPALVQEIEPRARAP